MDEAAILSLADADALMELVDDVAMPIPLRDDPMPATGLDWEKLRQQFEKLRKQSASEPVLIIEASGEVIVAPRPEELPLKATQDGEVVVVWHTPEGLEVVRIDRWQALKERPTLVPY